MLWLKYSLWFLLGMVSLFQVIHVSAMRDHALVESVGIANANRTSKVLFLASLVLMALIILLPTPCA